MVTRTLPAFACCMLLWQLVASGAGTDDAGTLKVPGICAIGRPGKAWHWKAVSEYDPARGGTYVCSAAGQPERVFLQIEPGKVATDADRTEKLKVHFNSLREQLEKLGCTDIKGKRPGLTAPIPDDVGYFVFGKTPKGSTVNIHAHTIFHEHTYLVQAVAPSLEDAQKLIAVEKTLKEE